MKIVLACNFKRDETLGSSRVPLRLADELVRAGANVTTLFSGDLPQVGNPRVQEMSAPVRMGLALRDAARDADIVDIAGGDGWPYALFRRWMRPHQRVIARSNGLWFRALAVEPTAGRTPVRELASRVYQSQILCRWERQSISAADLSVFGAAHDAEDVVRRGWTTPERVAVVAPGVDECFESDVPVERRSGVAFVGTLSHRKGSDIVCAAMSQVMLRRSDLELALFGTGFPESAVRAKFDERVRARIRIEGMLPPSELARQVGRYAILLFPTRYEGFGLVTLEAMRAGLAAVVTPTGAGADVVRDGHNGLVVPIDDVAATAAAVERLVDDPRLRIRLAEAGREEARRRPWSRTARELLGAYERALARPAIGPA